MFATILMFVTALTLSGVAAWFSIVGMIAIFSAAPMSIAIMAGSLEAAKLVCASWVYNNWRQAPLLIKSYLTLAVLILMFITSLGIFGYLSKAHLEQRAVGSETQLVLARLDQEIQTLENQKTRLLATEDRLNNAIDRMVERDRVTQALSQRRRMQTELNAIAQERRELQTKLDQLYTEKIPLELENKKLEVEIGPLKYIAELIYGDQARSHFDQAVRFVIILLVVVFDPLAVSMLIAANFGWRLHRESKEQPAAMPAKEVETPAVATTAPPVVEVIHEEIPKLPPDPTVEQALNEVEQMLDRAEAKQDIEPKQADDNAMQDKLLRVRQGINQRVVKLGPGYASFDGKPVSDTARKENPVSRERAAELVDALMQDKIAVMDLSWDECDAVLNYLEAVLKYIQHDKPTNIP